jgi:hypothetical protein
MSQSPRTFDQITPKEPPKKSKLSKVTGDQENKSKSLAKKKSTPTLGGTSLASSGGIGKNVVKNDFDPTWMKGLEPEKKKKAPMVSLNQGIVVLMDVSLTRTIVSFQLSSPHQGVALNKPF